MSRESRLLAGILLVIIPSVMYGGISLLDMLMRGVPGYNDNPLRHDLWRAGHAHAGVYLVLSLVMLHYVDEAALSPAWAWLARLGAPIAAILIPAAFPVRRLSYRKSAQRPDQAGLRRSDFPGCRRPDARHRPHSRRSADGLIAPVQVSRLPGAVRLLPSGVGGACR